MQFNNNKNSEGAVFRPQSKKLLDQVAEVMRYYHYSKRSETSYIRWIKQFVLFNDKRHPAEMGKPEIERYLSHLAVNRHVVAGEMGSGLASTHSC